MRLLGRLLLPALLVFAVSACGEDEAVEPEPPTLADLQALQARVARLDTRLAQLEADLSRAELHTDDPLQLVGEDIMFTAGVNEILTDSAIAVGGGDWPFEDGILVLGGEGLSTLELGDIVRVSGEVVLLEQPDLEERLGEVPPDLEEERTNLAIEASEVLLLEE